MSKQSTLSSFFGAKAQKKEKENDQDLSNKTADIETPSKTNKRKESTQSPNEEDPKLTPRKRIKKKREVEEEEDLDLVDEDFVAEQAKAVKTEVEEESPKKESPVKATERGSGKADLVAVKKEGTKVEVKEDTGVMPGNISSYFAQPLPDVAVPKTKSPAKRKPLVGRTKYATTNFDPVKDAMWNAGDKVPYLALAKTFDEIQKVKGRIQITELLTNLFRSIIALSPDDLLPAVYLSINRLAPEYVGLELGIGESILMKAVADATGRTLQSVKSSYNELGDLGLVAQASKGTQRTMFAPPKLTVQSVFKKLKEIASLQGSMSQSKKKEMIQSLLVAARESEPQYIIRSLQGKLRIGLAEKTVQAAIAHSVLLTPPGDAEPDLSGDLDRKLENARQVVVGVFSELPSYDVMIPTLLTDGLEELPKKCFLTPGIPVKPMLAQPTKRGISEVLDRFSDSRFTCEYKYDGERAQIHCTELGIKIYSRNLENNTLKYPDIIENLPKVCKEGVSSYILDGEVVAWDPEKNCILPFQILSTRARKDVQIADIKVKVCLYAFDLLYLNGRSLTKESLATRRDLLHSSFNPVGGMFAFAEYKDLSDTEEIQAYLEQAVSGNCEGLMVKTLDKDATYEPSRRSYKWLKVKKDYIEGMGDSLDLVVIGGYYGRGKRTGVFGGYLLACYDEDSETYQSITKAGTGFSDEALQQHTEFFKKHIIDQPKNYYSYGEGVKPDVWFEPVQVWEIKAADLSLSPVHKAAIGLADSNKGIALRFPRFIRIREDKKPEEATNSEQVCEMYRNQKINHVEGGGGAEEEEDY